MEEPEFKIVEVLEKNNTVKAFDMLYARFTEQFDAYNRQQTTDRKNMDKKRRQYAGTEEDGVDAADAKAASSS